ncbi:PASTA domain-containing protein [Streptomyces sp. DH37]|uniref:PASTA domain-containing protein n=1 Tax=Streptomyces sp. DH37 TaxID=3040122 RepID=UPI002440FDFF|nr:PASTA domain-containing protein [Streptomyces sp. DH37]MDG9704418.1 PASTA domain-containing protein [Streptomyces sp. DH37]
MIRSLPGRGKRAGGRAAIRGKFIAFGVFGAFLLGACSDGDAGAEPKETVTVTATATATVTATATATVTAKPESISSQKDAALEEAREAAEAAGYTVSAHNANEGDAEPSGNWKVCFEDIGYGTVDYGAVEEGALCPKKDGGPLTWPRIPGVTGTVYAKAVKALVKAGLDEENVSVESVYKDVSVSSADVEGDADGYTVCFQSPSAGKDVKPGTEAVLTLVEGGSCPSGKGTYQDRKNDPDYTPPPPPSDSGSGGSGSTGGSGGSGTAQWNGQCELTSPAGNCYQAGQFCANKHLGMQTHNSAGRIIYCKQRADGQRWNYS